MSSILPNYVDLIGSYTNGVAPDPLRNTFAPMGPMGSWRSSSATPQPSAIAAPGVDPEEELKRKKLMELLGQPMPGMEPQQAYSLPKIPGWLAAIAALLSVSDPSQQTGPAIAQGLATGSAQKAQVDAQNAQRQQQEAMARRQAQIDAAKFDYSTTADAADSTRKFQQQKELATITGSSRYRIEQLKAMAKMAQGNPEARQEFAKMANADPELAQALAELTADEKLKGARANDITSMLPVNMDYKKALTEGSRANAGLANEKKATEIATRPGKVEQLTAGNKYTNERTKNLAIANKYGDATFKAKLEKIKNEADKAKAEAAKTRASGNTTGDPTRKPVTDTAALSNLRQIESDRIDSEAKLRTHEAAVEFWTKRRDAIKGGRYKVAAESGESEEEAQARGLQEANDSIEYNTLNARAQKETVNSYKQQIADTRKQIADSQAGAKSTEKGWPAGLKERIDAINARTDWDQAKKNLQIRKMKQSMGVDWRG